MKCILVEDTFNLDEQVGETESITNDLNPDFLTPFTVDYFFKTKQKFKFSITCSGDSVEEIGSIEVYLGSLLTASNAVWEENLYKNGQRCGKIIVRVSNVNDDSVSY